MRAVFDKLLRAYGPQHWWPVARKARSPQQAQLEIAIGAVLTQNTSWKNVERAIAALYDAGLMDVHKLHALPVEALAQVIRPAGTYRVKARRLKALVEHIHTRLDGQLSTLASLPPQTARAELLAVHGIGPETADAILLYAAGVPTFVVDAYTHRLFRRHGWIARDETYGQVQTLVHQTLPRDAQVHNEFHALIVELGKRHCRATARCEGCPLRGYPHDAGL